MQNLDNVYICGSLCYEQIIDIIKVYRSYGSNSLAIVTSSFMHN